MVQCSARRHPCLFLDEVEDAIAFVNLMLMKLKEEDVLFVIWDSDCLYLNRTRGSQVVECNARTIVKLEKYFQAILAGDFEKAKEWRIPVKWNAIVKRVFGKTWIEISKHGIWWFDEVKYNFNKRTGYNLPLEAIVNFDQDGRELFDYASKRGVFDLRENKNNLPFVICGFWVTHVLTGLVRNRLESVLRLFKSRNSPTHIIIQDYTAVKDRHSGLTPEQRVPELVARYKRIADILTEFAEKVNRITGTNNQVKIVPVSNIFAIKIQGVFVLCEQRHSLVTHSEYFLYSFMDGDNNFEYPSPQISFNQLRFGLIDPNAVKSVAKALFPESQREWIVRYIMHDWAKDLKLCKKKRNK